MPSLRLPTNNIALLSIGPYYNYNIYIFTCLHIYTYILFVFFCTIGLYFLKWYSRLVRLTALDMFEVCHLYADNLEHLLYIFSLAYAVALAVLDTSVYM